MAFQVFPQNAGLTGLLRGAQASATQAGADLTDEERRLLEQRIRAREQLGQRFGPGAQDPSGLAVIGQSQAQQGFADAGQRRVDLAEQAFASEEEQIDLENRRRTFLGLVNAGLQGLANGTPPEQVLANLERLVPIVGANDQDIEELRQGFATDPQGTLTFLRDALATPTGNQRQAQAIGAPQAVQIPGTDRIGLAVPFDLGNGQTGAQFLRDEQGNVLEAARFGRALAREGTTVSVGPDGQLRANVIPGGPTEVDVQRGRQQISETQREREATQRAERQNAQIVVTQSESALDRTQEVLDLLDQVPGSQGDTVLSATSRALQSFAPGTAEFQLAQQLEALRNNVGLQALTSLDATLTPVSDRDFAALTQAIGQLETSTDPRILRRSIADIRRLVGTIRDQALEAIPEDQRPRRRGRQGGRQEEERIDFDFQNGVLVPRGQ